MGPTDLQSPAWFVEQSRREVEDFMKRMEEGRIELRPTKGEEELLRAEQLREEDELPDLERLGHKLTEKKYSSSSTIGDPWPVPLRMESPPQLELDESSVIEQKEQVRVFCCTWNLMGKSVPESLLPQLIPKNAFHLYCIGTQECERSIAKSVVITSKRGWETKLQQYLGPQYKMLRSHTLQATHLVIFIRQELLKYVSNLGSAAVATGYKDTLGNKGGVGISFQLARTSFLFIASHLEAHQNAVKQRNEHFHRIDTQMALPPNFRIPRGLGRKGSFENKPLSYSNQNVPEVQEDMDQQSQPPRARNGMSSANNEEEAAVRQVEDEYDSDEDEDDLDLADGADNLEESQSYCFEHPMEAATAATVQNGYEVVPFSDAKGRVTNRFDRVFWVGDFNYRINGDRPKVEGYINAKLAKGHKKLLSNDQLKIEMSQDRVFYGFEEGPLNFLPTYKFDKNCNQYDTSKKQRIPAWTDRVLHRSTEEESIRQLHYDSVQSITLSDHRPVCSYYDVRINGCKDPTLVGLDDKDLGKATSQVCSMM